MSDIEELAFKTLCDSRKRSKDKDKSAQELINLC